MRIIFGKISVQLVVFGIFLLVVVLQFAVLTEDILFKQSDLLNESENLGEILEKDTYIQEFTCTENGLDTISLLMGTYGRENQCDLSVELWQGGVQFRNGIFHVDFWQITNIID